MHQFVHALEAELDFQKPVRDRRVHGDPMVLFIDADIDRVADVIGDLPVED